MEITEKTQAKILEYDFYKLTIDLIWKEEDSINLMTDQDKSSKLKKKCKRLKKKNTALKTYGTASSIQHTFSGNIRGREMSIKIIRNEGPKYSYLMKNYHFKNPQSSTGPKKDKHRAIHTKT